MFDRIFAATWLLLCSVLAVVAWGFLPPFAYEPVGPRAYPLLLLALMGAGALWILIKPDTSRQHLGAHKTRRAAFCILTLLAYALLFEPMGFVLSTALAAFALGLLFGGRPRNCAIAGALLGASLYVLFDRLLDVPLPLGLFDLPLEK